jgi:hypothetical protein
VGQPEKAAAAPGALERVAGPAEHAEDPFLADIESGVDKFFVLWLQEARAVVSHTQWHVTSAFPG